MNTLLSLVFFAVGLVALLLGGRWLRQGFGSLARLAGWGAVGIGLSAVAVGASTPELAVTVVAGRLGASGLALGTIVGSVVFHMLFILGLSALVAPLSVSARWIRRTIPLIILAAVGLLALAWDGTLSRSDGALLLGAMVLWWAWTLLRCRRESEPVRAEFASLVDEPGPQRSRDALDGLLRVVVGVTLLALGAFATLEGVRRSIPASQASHLLFGLTAIAVGTSLPELATSLWATRHGKRDVAVGQVVGGSLTTLLGVTGLAALVAPQGLEVGAETARLDLELLIGVAIFGTPIFFLGSQVRRWEGFFFVTCYAGYLAWLILRALWPGQSGAYLQLVVMLAVPLTVIMVMLAALRTLRRQRPARPVRHRIRGI